MKTRKLVSIGGSTKQTNLKDSLAQEQKDSILEEIIKEKEPINQN